MSFSLYCLVQRSCDITNTELITMQSIGTLHSCRYVNIVLWFTDNDRIPVLNQSYGQAILGSMSRMLRFENTNFTFVLWLAISISFLHLFIFGILARKLERRISVVLTAVVTMGNVSLSLYPVLIVDSGYPLLHSGYIDSVVGCTTLVIYLAYLIHILEETYRLTGYDYLFSGAFMIYWAMSAPQNIIMIGGIGICFICYLAAKRKYDCVQNAFRIACAIFAGSVLGILEGGMLTPGGMVEQIDLPGVMQFTHAGDASLRIGILPAMPYHIASLNSWSWQLPYIENIIQYAKDAYHSGEFGLLIYHISLLFWDSIRIVFWALLGIVLQAYRAYSRKKFDYGAASGVIMFVLGYAVSFCFKINNYKWELSRFMMPAYFVGMIFLASWLGRLWKEKRYCPFAAMAITLILAGNVPYKVYVVYEKCRQSDMVRVVKEMIQFADRYI